MTDDVSGTGDRADGSVAQATERDDEQRPEGDARPDGSLLNLGRRDYMKTLGAAGLAGIGASAAAGTASADSVGAGAYTTSPPSGATVPQSTIYTTSDVSGPIQTNEWWSSLLWTTLGNNLFPHPGFGQPTQDGLGIDYPSDWSTVSSAAVINFAADFTLGHTATTFSETRVSGWSDWSVDVTWGAGTSTSMTVTITQGSPFFFAEYTGGGAELAFNNAPTVWADRGNVLGVTIGGDHYGLFAPAGATWSGVGTATLTNDLAGTNGSGYVSIAILPDNSTATLDQFQQYAYNFITDTQVSPTYDRANGRVTATYSFTTDNKPESSAAGTITALYPHQHKNTTDSTLSHTYTSPRGTMQALAGSSFTTEHTFPGVLPGLPNVGASNSRLQTLVNSVD
ncbi:MAG: glycoside hydrolase family 81, partial [Haloarculaceae archaeon]